MFGQYFGNRYFGDTYFGPAAGGAPVIPIAQPDGPHGPGWAIFGQDARPPRKRKVEDLEQDIIRAYEDASGETAERERLEAIREIKRAAATALSVAKKEDDAKLKELSEKIIALKRLELTALEYIARVGAIIQAQEDDDMEAFVLMARLA